MLAYSYSFLDTMKMEFIKAYVIDPQYSREARLTDIAVAGTYVVGSDPLLLIAQMCWDIFYISWFVSCLHFYGGIAVTIYLIHHFVTNKWIQNVIWIDIYFNGNI